ncbi:MAG TPA: crossover junction endodeoxyribonuclease RuvC [Bacteroidota bacterium]|nr:crossover junction endodeoxyribonuclease RuvC [Bacteroidota bacterium]
MRRSTPKTAPAVLTVLGIDPGTLATGFGVVEIRRGTMRMVTAGTVRNSSDRAMADRLKLIHDSIREVIRRFHPDEVALETAFYGKNAQSALKLGQARGVAILAAVSQDLPLAEYSPLEIKKAVVGNGTASKQQVQFMVKSILSKSDIPAGFDATDALAVAICHTHRRASGSARHADWKSFLRDHPERLGTAGEVRR